jgi:hypothetical protein
MGHNLEELRKEAEKSLSNWYLKSTKS